MEISSQPQIQIPEGIKEFIFKYRFKDFLKENQKHEFSTVLNSCSREII